MSCKCTSWPEARAIAAPASSVVPVVLVAQANDGSRVTRTRGVGGFINANHSQAELAAAIATVVRKRTRGKGRQSGLEAGAAPPTLHPLADLAAVADQHGVGDGRLRGNVAEDAATGAGPAAPPPSPPAVPATTSTDTSTSTSTSASAVLTGMTAEEAAALSDRLVCSDVFEVLAVGDTMDSMAAILDSAAGGWVRAALSSLTHVQQLHHRWQPAPATTAKKANARSGKKGGGGQQPGVGKKRIKAFHKALAAQFGLAVSTVDNAAQLCLFTYPAPKATPQQRGSAGGNGGCRDVYVLAIEWGGAHTIREYCDRFGTPRSTAAATASSSGGGSSSSSGNGAAAAAQRSDAAALAINGGADVQLPPAPAAPKGLLSQLNMTPTRPVCLTTLPPPSSHRESARGR